MEKTFIMIKPDGVKKGLIGEIIKRFEQKGLMPEAMKYVRLTKSEAETLYAIHRGKPFFEPLVQYVTSGPVVLMVWSGDGVIDMVRKMMGATDPKEALPGTIRGDFATELTENVIHGSDSPDSAAYEIPIFFPELKS